MGIKFVTVGFIAKDCDVSHTTVLRWINTGYLSAIKLPSRQNRVFRGEFERFKNL